MMQDILQNAGPCRIKCRISCRTGAGARVSLWIMWITRPLIHNRMWITRRKPSKSEPMARNKLYLLIVSARIGSGRIVSLRFVAPRLETIYYNSGLTYIQPYDTISLQGRPYY